MDHIGKPADDRSPGRTLVLIMAVLRAAADRGEPFNVAIRDMRMASIDGLPLSQHIEPDPTIKEVGRLMLSSGNHPAAEALSAAGRGRERPGAAACRGLTVVS